MTLISRVACGAAVLSLTWSLAGLQLASISTGELKVRGTFSAETGLFAIEDKNYHFDSIDVRRAFSSAAPDISCASRILNGALLASHKFCCAGR